MSVNKFIGGQLKMVAGLTPGGGGTGSIIKVQLASTKGNTISNVGITLNIKNKEYSSITDNDGVAIFNGVTEVGTMTVTAATKEFIGQTFKIEFFGSYELFMTDSDPYEDWLEAAGLNPASYEDIDELLEDEAAVRTLMTKTAAVDILANYITEERLEKIINHRYAAKWINYREYAYSTLSANENIKELMDESEMYGMYITAESKSRPLVPVLISNTGSDGGETICSSEFSSTYAAWKAFDVDNSSCWVSTETGSTDINIYIGYKFTIPTLVKRFRVNTEQVPLNGILQGSYDNSKWDDISNFDIQSSGINDVDINNSKSYLYYRLYIKNQTHSTDRAGQIKSLQFYGYQLEGLIPKMTSNTSPSGEASASSEFDSTLNPAWKAFNGTCIDTNDGFSCNSSDGWLQYKFVVPTVANKIMLMNRNYTGSVKNGSVKEFKILGSNNGSEFTELGTFIHSSDEKLYTNYYNLNNNKAYLYYRLVGISTHHPSNSFTIGQLQLYGEPTFWQPKGLVPVMTNKTAPYGEALSSVSDYNIYYDWKAFDGDTITAEQCFYTGHVALPQRLGYKFSVPTCCTRVDLWCEVATNINPTKWTIEASNNGTDWIVLGSFENPSPDTGRYDIMNIDNENYYLYYSINVTEAINTLLTPTQISLVDGFSVQELQFYGRQLEALIPLMTSNTTPMGEASASMEASDWDAWKAFKGGGDAPYWSAGNVSGTQWLQYKFDKPLCVKSFKLSSYYNNYGQCLKNFEIVASNNGIEFEKLYVGMLQNDGLEVVKNLDNNKSYTHYRINT